MSYNTEGSGVGFLGEPPVVCNCEDKQPNSVGEISSAAAHNGARISFRFQLCEQTAVVWHAVLYKSTLYLKPGESLPDGSKDAFVSLLEYTEEYLKCKQIFVCLKKDLFDRAALVRTFMFLGFLVVPPNHPMAPGGDYLSLLYTIEEDSDEDSDGYD